MFNGAKRMTCIEVRDILSDLIDVRNGEIPPVGASRLSMPEVRADAESHLAGCTDCRAELIILEEVGNVFADFNVGEMPAQHFADYGQVVRARMAMQTERKIIPIRAGRQTGWWKIGASAAVAACAVFGFMHFNPKTIKTRQNTAIASKSPKLDTRIPSFTQPTPMNVLNVAVGQPKRDWIYNPEQPKLVMEELNNNETRYGYLILGEKVAPTQMPLLGVLLKTTRDEDRDMSRKGQFGLKVFDIVPDSVANEMGLLKDDEIVCINGMNVNSGSVEDAVKFLEVIHNLNKGAVITVDVVRQDKAGVLYTQRRGVLGEPKAVFE